MEPAASRRETTKTQNRQIILDAARRVFAEIGFGGATVRDIIRATSLASGTFYNYFKSKEEVYEALREDVALALWEPLQPQLADAATPDAFLSACFRGVFDFALGNPTEFRHLRPAADSRFREGTVEVPAVLAPLRAALHAATLRGLFGMMDADFLAAAILGVALEISESLLQRALPDAAAATIFASALLLGGLPAIAAPSS